MSTVTGRYTDAQGNPASGTVYISPAARAGIGEPPDIVTEKRVWADLDEQGRISIDVIPSDDPGWLIDGQMPYLVEERLMGLPFRSYWIGVPDAGVDLSAVQQVDPDVAYVPVPGPTGPQGDTGPQGEVGPAGPPGAAALSGWWNYSNIMTGPAASGQVRTSPLPVAVGETFTLWISTTDADGIDWSLVSPTVGDQVVLRSASGETWTATITVLPAVGEWTCLLDSSTGTAPKKNTRVQVSLVMPSMTQDQADARYVNTTGDTMTAGLILDPSDTYALTLKKAGQFVAALRPFEDKRFWLHHYGAGTRIMQITATGGFQIEDASSLIVPAPTAAQQVPRLARTPNSATGDLGLPGYAGSDTGWRDVSADLLNGWTATRAYLRRTGDIASLHVYQLDAAAQTNTHALTVPVGFRAGMTLGTVGWLAAGATGAAATNPASNVVLAGSSGETLRIAASLTGSQYTTTITWPCDGAWPTSLPGTQVTPPASWS